jgi:hypothetical protein
VFDGYVFFFGDTAASTGAMEISKRLFLSVPIRWDHGLVPVFFSIPLGGGALDDKLGKLPLFFMARRWGSGLILTTDYIAEPIRVWSLLVLSILQTQVLMCFKPGYFQALAHAWTWLFCWCLLKICFRISLMIKRAQEHIITRFLSLH